MKTYELRSDTFTRPTEEVRKAMYAAEVGDDVYGEDPTINRLQDLAAEMTGMEAGLFVTSGTMGNLLPLWVLGGRGNEVLLHEQAHILHHEVAGISAVAGALPVSIPGDRGILSPVDLEGKIKKNDYDIAHTKLIAIENSHNFCGGTCWSASDLKSLRAFADREELKIHMDGARMFNASVATGLSARNIASSCDSLTFCLSKGLGAPVGSMICGTREMIEETRRVRKIIGGGMRQAGVLAAAGIFVLENNINRLADDHENLKQIAAALKETSWAELPADPETNILFFKTIGRTARVAAAKMEEQGIRSIAVSENEIRLVTSLEITEKETQEICQIIKAL